ncbi:MAG: esterase [Verrucomicrobia bacterium]|nr:MAG: esterase [Verrucomicrobiota bacterium]
MRSLLRSSKGAAIVGGGLLFLLPGLIPALAQPRGNFPPPVRSPEVHADGKVTFRLRAPDADRVELGGSDLPGTGFNRGIAMTKNEDGVWEVTIGPLEPGSYRYRFRVEGVPVMDPRNPRTSESNENAWSLVHVPGAKWMDVQDVPHGAICEVTYWSTVLERFRRLHVYLPPGYETSGQSYPVFYLLHGAFDSDDSWSTVGRAGVIMDNLIAEGRAKPMVVVMPHGHTGPFRFGAGFGSQFEKEFVTDIMPLMEKRYRVRTDRASRALAGLSMGGFQTLNIGIPNLEKFAYLGVFSSGIFGLGGGPGGDRPRPDFEEQNKAVLDNAELKKGLRLFWFATGRDDFLIETSRATVELFRKHGFEVTWKETDGAHTWKNWREYLHEFAPLLFR